MNIQSTDHIFTFSKEHRAIRSVPVGKEVTFHTLDAFSNQIVDQTSTFDKIDMNAVNPATGPVFVDGAKPGDTLKVEIVSIDLDSQGVMAVAPGLGVLGDQVNRFQAKLMDVRDDHVIFSDEISFPVRKMVGVIGVAPTGEAVSCGTPGNHGGNMDNSSMTEGSTVYFPVSCDGALFALGDVHAAMGDGEVCVTGVEIAARVTVKFSVVKEAINLPWLETSDSWQVIASAETFEEAGKRAASEWTTYLATRSRLTSEEAMMLLSASSNLEICQAVNPLKTVRLKMPKSILQQTGVE
ncbi:acetamidase/formamidase family protein [Geomicrobium sp. JCM 19039]|uniref:acetamidase/formamidase family protein n=1 Tax=Geomicrobium sp. JCM 19039 TaxID=1460636 RepID=UPI00045F150A|nr:acetamidase/formamidase family protein [Geomicrobium sp. JCM 19039]GAK11134.1 acetamidase/formamidase [Geomicrobium sp. JCM 19039]